jgi:hypothetical protein
MRLVFPCSMEKVNYSKEKNLRTNIIEIFFFERHYSMKINYYHSNFKFKFCFLLLRRILLRLKFRGNYSCSHIVVLLNKSTTFDAEKQKQKLRKNVLTTRLCRREVFQVLISVLGSDNPPRLKLV